MSVTTTTHLNFRGDARAALDFYHSVVGGRLAAVTYKDAGAVRAGGEAEADWVMWGEVAAGNGFHVMAYDVPSALPWDRGENAFFVSLRGDSAGEITALWEKLAAGAAVVRPLGPAPWAPLYGMLTDRFGVVWVLDVAVPGAAGGAR
jgi:PhnB protein